VRQENPLTHRASQSELEPDIAVVQGKPNDHRDAHPTTAELIIEVAIASVELDRAKGAVYAEVGVPEFWIVLPDERAIEVYTSPSAQGYQQMRRHEDVAAPLTTIVFPQLSITPRDLFA
jgi:Uma2 family endonuclease